MSMNEPLRVKLLKRGFPHRHIIAKLTRTPVIGGVMDGMLFQLDDMACLPKDQVIQMGKTIDGPAKWCCRLKLWGISSR